MNIKHYLVLLIIITGAFTMFNNNFLTCFAGGCPDESISPDSINKLISTDEITLVDVREQYEWDEGHISGAQLIPLSTINTESTKDLPKDKPVYVYCRSGNRAGTAVNIFKELGFKKVVNAGGVIDWTKSGGELIK